MKSFSHRSADDWLHQIIQQEREMNHPVKGVDHVFLLVSNLDEAAKRYAELGFTISPRGLHSAAKGSANHTIMFPEDYFELLGLLKKTPGNAGRFEALERMGEGLHAIACRIDDASEASKALGDLGIATEGLGSFERPVPLPDGTEGIAAFSTVAFTSEEVPFGTVFMCQHRTRETVWLPELIKHPNSACGLNAILAVSEDPQQDADAFARLWANSTVAKTPTGAQIETGKASAPLELFTPQSLKETYPWLDVSSLPKGAFAGLRIDVQDIKKVRASLDAANIAAHPTAKGLAVAPVDACGTIVEFVAK
ncbi:VOC family protein [Lutimaribacter saemankumensis]|nr:VOC family protein [Lutimaribacter saemankumensis]